MISMNLTEFFAGHDWEENQHTPQEQLMMISDLQYGVFDAISHVGDRMEIIEYVFRLYIRGKPRKSMFLKDMVIEHFNTVYRNRPPPVSSGLKNTYNISLYGHNKNIDFDFDGISEFVIFLNGFNLKPSKASKIYLNKDIIAFLEL
jgi:hypothetical protein